MVRDLSLSDKRKKTGASLIKCHLQPRLGNVPLTGIDKATLGDPLMWPAQETGFGEEKTRQLWKAGLAWIYSALEFCRKAA
ncbi:hypothetical protein [Pseudomonas viridiflava]|uniref:hypothetical protein n=1 Tax=Pseudomonas viridiflava TaxID=33069 RepID=UPI001F077C66|nr:hypothetical protein [Pseudomonas viridiflava]